MVAARAVVVVTLSAVVVVVTVAVVVVEVPKSGRPVVVAEGGKGEAQRCARGEEREKEWCPAWTCAPLHGRPGDSLSAR